MASPNTALNRWIPRALEDSFLMYFDLRTLWGLADTQPLVLEEEHHRFSAKELHTLNILDHIKRTLLPLKPC